MPTQLAGEWWIIDGSAVFADGDVGDFNHEGYVLECLLEAIRSDIEEAGVPIRLELGMSPTDVRCAIIEQSDLLCRDGRITDEQCEDPYEWLAEAIGWEKSQLDALCDNESELRWWASKTWGWIQVRSNHLTLAGPLTSGKLESIKDGLWDAYDDQVEGQTLHIEALVESDGSHLGSTVWDVPWEILENVTSSRHLQNYLRSGSSR